MKSVRRNLVIQSNMHMKAFLSMNFKREKREAGEEFSPTLNIIIKDSNVNKNGYHSGYYGIRIIMMSG